MATFIEEVKRKAIEMAEEEMTHIIENATDEYRAGVDILFGLALARFIEKRTLLHIIMQSMGF